MDPSRRAQEEASPEAVEFVRFCYRRKRAGWPEIYDEMCAVAGRGLYHGWTHADLAEHGIGFSLFQMPALATLARRVIADEDTRRIFPTSGAHRRTATRETVTTEPAEDPTTEIAPSLAAAVA